MRESEGRTTAPLMALYFAAFCALALTEPFDGPSVQVSKGYRQIGWWLWLPLSLVIGWGFQRLLVGRVHKSRGGKTRILGARDSWVIGIFLAAIFAMLMPEAVGNVVNSIVGVPYTATYTVTGKAIERGKHTCYDLVMTKQNDPTDRFDVCASQSQYESTVLGDRMQVDGRRSRCMNKMLSFAKSS